MSVALRFALLASLMLTTGCSAVSWLYLGEPSSTSPSEDESLVLARKDFIVDGAIKSQITLNNGNKVFAGHFERIRKPVSACYKYVPGASDLSSLCSAISDKVYAIETDGADGFYISGENGNLLHMKSNGTLSNWQPVLTYFGQKAIVTSLRFHNGVLYVGGAFTHVGSEARAGIAAFDTAIGQLTSWNPGLAGFGGYNYLLHPDMVMDMIVIGSQLFVMGFFEGGGQNAVHSESLISLNLADDNADPNFIFDPNLITLFPPKLFYVRGVLLAGNLLMNPTDGSYIEMNLDAGIAGGGGSYLTSYDVNGDTLWVVGRFTSLGGVSTINVAAFDLSGVSFSTAPVIKPWTNQASAPDGKVDLIHAAGNTLLIAGPFGEIGGTTVPSFAFLNASDASLKTQPSYEFDALDGGFDMEKVNGEIFLVGGFYKSYPRNNLFMVDANNHLTSWDPDVDGEVRALSTDGTTIFVGGDFTVIGQNALTRGNIAQIDAAGNATAMVSDTDQRVNALKYHNSFLYVGGEFTTVNGVAVNALAKIDPTTGAGVALVSNVVVDSNSSIWGLEVIGETLIVAGEAVTTNLFAYDLTAGSLIAGWNPIPDGRVTKMIVTSDHQIIVAGDFTQVDGIAKNGLAKLNLGSSTPDSWSPVLIDSGVDHLEAVGNTLVVYGRRPMNPRPFTQILDLSTGADTTLERAIVPTGIVPM